MVLLSAFNITDHSPSLFKHGRCIVGFSHRKDSVKLFQDRQPGVLLGALVRPYSRDIIPWCDASVALWDMTGF